MCVSVQIMGLHDKITGFLLRAVDRQHNYPYCLQLYPPSLPYIKVIYLDLLANVLRVSYDPLFSDWPFQ